MYQYAWGIFEFGTSTTMRFGKPCVNFSSQVIGYGLGFGKSARTGDVPSSNISAATIRDGTTEELRGRDIGVILRAGASQRAGRGEFAIAARTTPCILTVSERSVKF